MMSTFKLVAVLALSALLALTVAPTAARAQTSPRAASLAELIAMAEERSPTLAAARQSVAASEAAVALARVGLGVTLTARGSAGVSGSTTAATSSSSSSASLGAAYTLYDSGQTAYAVQQAEANLRSARAALEAARQDTSLAVGQAYVAVLRAERGVALQQQQVARNQELVRIAQGQFDAGVVPRSDVVRAQAGLAAAQSDLIAAESAVVQSKASLGVAIGVGPMAQITVAPPTEVPQATVLQTDLARLIEQRAEVRKALSDAEAAEAAVRVARASGGLKVALESTVAQAFAPAGNTTYSIGASVSFPISDAGRASASLEQATANLLAARARIESVRLTTLQDAVTALLGLSVAQARLDSARASLAFAEESVRLARGRYGAGVAPIFEVIDAQTALVAAEVVLSGVEFDRLAAALQLRRALGRSVADGEI